MDIGTHFAQNEPDASFLPTWQLRSLTTWLNQPVTQLICANRSTRFIRRAIFGATHSRTGISIAHMRFISQPPRSLAIMANYSALNRGSKSPQVIGK